MKHQNLYPNKLSGALTLDSFGMLMKERTFSSTSYRFGFNGKEKTDEINGDGAVYDYGFRIYDSRLSRFFSEDPITDKYPELTPYQFASNKPISSIDIDGLEGFEIINDLSSGKDKPLVTIVVNNSLPCGTIRTTSKVCPRNQNFTGCSENSIDRSARVVTKFPYMNINSHVLDLTQFAGTIFSRSELVKESTKLMDIEQSKFKLETDKEIGTVETIIKNGTANTSINVNGRTEIFTTSATVTSVQDKTSYQIIKSIDITAENTNSVYIQQLANTYRSQGFNVVLTQAAPGALAIKVADPNNPAGVKLNFEFEAKWDKNAVKTTVIDSVKSQTTGVEITCL